LSGNGVEVTAELVEELSNQVAGEVLDQYRGTSYESLFPNAFRTDGKFQTEGQSNVEALNRAIDIADYNGTGVYGQGALLEALTDGYYDSEIFGVPVVSAGFFNGIISFAFDDLPSTTPFAEVATYFRNKLLSRYSEEYLNSLTGFDTTLQNIGFLWGLSAIPSFIGAVLNAWGAIVNKLAPFGGVQTAAAPFSEDIYNNPNKRPSITPIYQEIADQYNNA